MEDLYTAFRPQIMELLVLLIASLFAVVGAFVTMWANRARAYLAVKELHEYRILFDSVIENGKKQISGATPDAIAAELLAYAETTAPHIIAKLKATREQLKTRMDAEAAEVVQYRQLSGGNF